MYNHKVPTDSPLSRGVRGVYNSISSQSCDNGGLSGMKDVHEKEALRKHFNETVEKFEKYYNDPEQHHKIFTELGFTYVDDGCDGFCPECEQKLECGVYEELKDEWEGLYCNN